MCSVMFVWSFLFVKQLQYNEKQKKYNIVKTASISNRKTVERGQTDTIKQTYRWLLTLLGGGAASMV